MKIKGICNIMVATFLMLCICSCSKKTVEVIEKKSVSPEVKKEMVVSEEQVETASDEVIHYSTLKSFPQLKSLTLDERPIVTKISQVAGKELIDANFDRNAFTIDGSKMFLIGSACSIDGSSHEKVFVLINNKLFPTQSKRGHNKCGFMKSISVEGWVKGLYPIEFVVTTKNGNYHHVQNLTIPSRFTNEGALMVRVK